MSSLAYNVLLTEVLTEDRPENQGAWRIDPQPDESLVVTCYSMDHVEVEVVIISPVGKIIRRKGDGSRMPTIEGDLDMLDIAERVNDDLQGE